MLAKDVSVLDIGVVTPYSAQVKGMRKSIPEDLAMRLQGSGVDLSGGLPGNLFVKHHHRKTIYRKTTGND